MRADHIVSTFDQVGSSMVSSMFSASMDARARRIAKAEQAAERQERNLSAAARIARGVAADKREIARLQAEAAAWRTRALRAEGTLVRQNKACRTA